MTTKKEDPNASTEVCSMKKTIASALLITLTALCLVSCNKPQKDTTDHPKSTSSAPTQSVVSFNPIPTETPTETLRPTVSPTVEPSPTVSSTETPTETPTPSVSPTEPITSPSPDNFKVLNSSGTFLSKTGTKLNLSVDWKIETLEDRTYQVSMDIYLDSYSLYCGKRESGNTIIIGQYEFPYTTPAMTFDTDSGKHHTLLTSVEVVYTPDTLPEKLELGATWKFNGTYSKVELGTIEAKTVIAISDLD